MCGSINHLWASIWIFSATRRPVRRPENVLWSVVLNTRVISEDEQCCSGRRRLQTGSRSSSERGPSETRTIGRRSALLRYARTQLRNFKAAPRISAGFTCVIISRMFRGAAVNSIVPFYCMLLFLEQRCCIGTSSFNVLLEDWINSSLRCAALQNSLGFSGHSCLLRTTVSSS